MSEVRHSPLTHAVVRGLVLCCLTLAAGCRSMAPAPDTAPPVAPAAPTEPAAPSAPAPPPAAAPSAAPAATAAPTVAYAWVQYNGGTVASARAILASGSPCPKIEVGSLKTSMTARAIPGGLSPANAYDGFADIEVCELDFQLSPATTTGHIVIDGYPQALPTPTGAADQMLVIGDTGCRVKVSDSHPGTPQWCEGGTLKRGAWGFPALAATATSQTRPDAILHVGDYLYRENTIKPDGDHCRLSPPDEMYRKSRGWVDCGYNWDSWQDDFFAPAKTSGILGHAPWIYVRGNHEGCTRAWNGYYLFFYPGPVPASCDPSTPITPYAVNLDGLDVYVVDTSNEDSGSAQSSFATVFDELAGSSTNSWLATHVPTTELGDAFDDSKLAQREFLRWLHVGHEHLFANMAPSGRQPETITGGSGTGLDSCPSGSVACDALHAPDECCYGATASDQGRYSYMVVESHSGKWSAALYDVAGSAEQLWTVSKK